MTRPNGAPCWTDLLTSETARAREFYAGLFGWTAGEAAEQFGGYFMFIRDGVPVAGCMPKVPGMPGTDGPDTWGVYLSSPDAKAVAEKALAHGGALRAGPMNIADLGTEAVLDDVAGARIGVWQARAYFKVADTDAALARAAELGGAVTQPAMDTPYGRLAGVSDPTGAAFKLAG